MPVADEDVVVGINITTGLAENVTIPATDRTIRPIVRHPDVGLMTLVQLQELYGGSLYANNTELYDCELPFEIEQFIEANVPYIEFMDGGRDAMRYISTDTFNYQLDYAIVSASGSGQVEITREEDLQRSGGAGGRGGGGGGDGSGSQDGDGRGGQDEQIRPFPAPPESKDEGLEHTCSDEEPEPSEPSDGEPSEPSEEEPCAACAAGIPKGQKGQGPTQTQSGTLSGSGQNQMDSGDSQGEAGESGEGQGESQSQGQGDSQGDASGQGQGEAGESQGSGSGESSGEGQGSGDGEGQGEGEGSGQGSGSSSGSGGGESSGEGSGQEPGQGQGQGEGEGSEGQGESQGEATPSSGQPTPSNQSGEASGGSEQSPQQQSLLEQLLDEQSQREQESSETGGEPSPSGEPGPMNPDEFMDFGDSDDLSGPNTAPTDLPDNYDDIFDDSSPFGPPDDGPTMNPDDFMDMPPQDPSPADEELPLTNDNMDDGNSYPLNEPSSAPRPFEHLSDDELQQLIDELRETPDPTNPQDFMEDDTGDVAPSPSPSPSPDPSNPPSPDQPSGPPSDTGMPNPGPNQQDSNEQVPDTSNTSSSTPEQGQSWLWINVGTGELFAGPSAPSTGIWVHALFADFEPSDRVSIDYDVIMTFDEVRRVIGDNATYYQPLPTMMTLDFDDAESYLLAFEVMNGMVGQYWDIEFDELGLNISITFNYLEQSPDTRPRWVPMSSDNQEDLSSSTFDDAQAQAQAMLDQINEENQMANDAGIPTGYGEGSTSPFVPESESNAQLQQDAAQAGANAAKGDAQMAQEGSSNETDNARQSAQQNARDAAAANDLDSALGSASEAIENAMRANASADPNNDEDVNNRNQAVSAANDALDSLAELLTEADQEVQDMVNLARESLDGLEVGNTPSMAQDLAQQAKDARDRAMEANNPIGSADNAMEATESAIQARQEAIPGDDKDREAVQEATNMAQQAIDAALAAGADNLEPYQQALDEIPAFNDLDELAVDAEARMRDTMPGEFADINNPNLAEDMMAVAEEAVKNLEQAVEQANPANQSDRDTTEYIAQKTQQTIDNVEGSWSGDPEEIEALRERVNEALADFSQTIENICALWNPDTMSWYRGTTGDILIFENMVDALVYGVQKNMIPDTVVGLPEDWRSKSVYPIGVGGVI